MSTINETRDISKQPQGKRIFCVGMIGHGFVIIKTTEGAPLPGSRPKTPAPIDFEAEADDLREQREDQAFWRTGGW